MYDPAIGRWITQDPLAEKYYSTSPHAYTLNNPVKFIDPDGMDVWIFGEQANEYMSQLQDRMKGRITLSLDGGRLNYVVNEGERLKSNAKHLANMIDNHDIIVNMFTTDKEKTSAGTLLVGGAFMGNKRNDDGTIAARQEVNPSVLGKIDPNGKSGMTAMHELTEAYAGARISQETGAEAGPAIMGKQNDIYEQAHMNATPQPFVYQRRYGRDGRLLTPEEALNVLDVYKREYYVPGRKTPIQTWIK
jgi:uncharacterized protein RhaS with RHS repeats